MDFQHRLYDLRKKAGLSQEELANLLGVTRQAVQKWEAGTSKPDLDNLLALAKYFNVSLDWLVSGQEAHSAPSIIVENHYYRWQYEYKSQRTLLGLPLVHIHCGPGFCRAKGILAIGNVATGVAALGGVSLGVFSLGGLSLGLLLALGGMAVGTAAVGGFSLGVLAMGGITCGWLSIGGIAKGTYALGGLAYGGRVAMGGVASGALAIGEQAKGNMTFPVDGSIPIGVIQQAIRQGAQDAPEWVKALLCAMVPL